MPVRPPGRRSPAVARVLAGRAASPPGICHNNEASYRSLEIIQIKIWINAQKPMLAHGP